MDKIEVYQRIMNNIVARTNGGQHELMSDEEREITTLIMRDIKEQMDRYYKEQYPIVCAWAAMPIETIPTLFEKSPDLTRFRSEEENIFNKLMGGSLY